MKQHEPIDREQLKTFFQVKSGLPAVLDDLNIHMNGKTTRWPVIMTALGLHPEQDPAVWPELMEQLMEAKDVAHYCGSNVRSIYRWREGVGLGKRLPMPRDIDLSGGRENARKSRWRRAEIVAWQNRQPAPAYAPAPSVFGSLTPIK